MHHPSPVTRSRRWRLPVLGLAALLGAALLSRSPEEWRASLQRWSDALLEAPGRSEGAARASSPASERHHGEFEAPAAAAVDFESETPVPRDASDSANTTDPEAPAPALPGGEADISVLEGRAAPGAGEFDAAARAERERGLKDLDGSLDPRHVTSKINKHRGIEAWEQAQQEAPRAAGSIVGVVRGQSVAQQAPAEPGAEAGTATEASAQATTLAPVAGATVTVHDRRFYDGRNRSLEIARTQSDEGGRFAFTEIPEGSYDVIVVHERYLIAQRTELALPAHQTLELSFTLSPSDLTTGVVVGAEGEPLAGARIEVYHPDARLFPLVTTDESGAFSITGLGERRYEMVFSHEGYETLRLQNVQGGGRDIAVALQPEAALGGRVYFQTKDEPVTLYRIRAVRLDGDGYDQALGLLAYEVHEVESEDGSFLLEGLPKGKYAVEVFHDRYGSKFVKEFRLQSGERLKDIEVFLDPGGVLKGAVTRVDDGMPLPNAQVALVEAVRYGDMSFPFDVSREILTETDARGEFSLAGLPAGTLRFWVAHEGHSRKMETIALAPGEELRVTWQLAPVGAIIEGGVWTEDGVPLSNMRLIATRTQLDTVGEGAGDYITAATTDAEGRYRFNYLPAGAYQVRVEAPSAGALMPPGADWQMVDVQDGQTREIRFGSPDKPNILGHLLDQNAPASGWDLYLVRADDPSMVMVANDTTREDGSFRFRNVKPGKYVVLNYDPSSPVAIKHMVTVPTGDPFVEITVRIEASGFAVSFIESDGSPFKGGGMAMVQKAGVPEQTASFDELLASFVAEKRISAEGMVEMRGMTPGSYVLRLRPTGRALARFDDVLIQEGAMTDLGTWTLTPEVILTGFVKTDADKPVANAVFTLTDEQGRWHDIVSRYKSNDVGRYRIPGLESGKYYTLTVAADGYAPAILPLEVTEAPGVAKTLDVTLSTGAKLTVVALDPGNKPVSGAQVRLFDLAGREVVRQVHENEALRSHTTTDGNGRLEMASIEPGAYRVRVEHPDFQPGEREVTVEPFGDATASITLLPPPPSEDPGG